MNIYSIAKKRGVFRTQLNIYDRVFSWKTVNGFSRLTIFVKNLIVDTRLGSKHASEEYIDMIIYSL